MRRWQAMVALAGLFALGVFSGSLGAHLYYVRSAERMPGPPPFLGPFFSHRLERGLDLSPAQRAEVLRILDDSHREAEALRGEVAPRLREVMERADERIRALLTPEQRQRFDEMRQRHRRRAERFYHGPGGRRPHRRHPTPEDG